jgi:hypothetical protein
MSIPGIRGFDGRIIILLMVTIFSLVCLCGLTSSHRSAIYNLNSSTAPGGEYPQSNPFLSSYMHAIIR